MPLLSTAKKLGSSFFEKAWRPLVFWLGSLIVLLLVVLTEAEKLLRPALVLFAVAMLLLVISVSVQIIRRRWLSALPGFLVLSATLIAAYLYIAAMSWMLNQEQPDHWADDLILPASVELCKPANLDFDEKRPDSLTKRVVTQREFQLYNSFQPGLYEFDFWIEKIDSGTVYLKAFEITHNQELSSDRLPESSSVKVYNATDSIQKFSTTHTFTIYEGDWGKPYAARFEVWFKPELAGKERLLFSKNYIIEGWMR